MTLYTPAAEGGPQLSDMAKVAAAVERLAIAVEQLVLTRLDSPTPKRFGSGDRDPYPPDLGPVEIGDPLPARVAPLAQCPVHHVDWKFVPGGVSKRTGKPYSSFYACPTQGCNQRPPA